MANTVNTSPVVEMRLPITAIRRPPYLLHRADATGPIIQWVFVKALSTIQPVNAKLCPNSSTTLAAVTQSEAMKSRKLETQGPWYLKLIMSLPSTTGKVFPQHRSYQATHYKSLVRPWIIAACIQDSPFFFHFERGFRPWAEFSPLDGIFALGRGFRPWAGDAR